MVFHHGELRESGTHNELLADAGFTGGFISFNTPTTNRRSRAATRLPASLPVRT